MVGYGIIGSGTMGREHIQNLRLIPEVRVVALADPHPDSLASAAALVGGPVATCDDHRDLLARDDVDVVVIATPNHTHAAVLADAFATTKALLVEKPLCTTIEDARAVVAAADRHQGLVWVAMEYRYMPPVARLIEEVRGGTVGRLRMLAIREHRFPFLVKVGGLEPLRPQHRRHPGREMLPLLRPDVPDRGRPAGADLRLGRPGRQSSRRAL